MKMHIIMSIRGLKIWKTEQCCVEEGDLMTLQEQVVQKVNGLSEENLQFLLDMMNRFMQSDFMENKMAADCKRIGIAKGQNLYDHDYDFDEMNDEIAIMFGGVE